MIYIFLVSTLENTRNSTTFSRYLPVNPEALRWEIHCNDAGYQQVPPGAHYPLTPEDHPVNYAATVATGRVLSEFQVVYLTAGQGVFECDRMGQCRVSAGDVMILFPGVRHAYHPIREIGWHEYWVGCSGEHAYRLWHNGLFQPERAVHHIGLNHEVMADYEQIVRLCRQQTPGFQVRLGALVLQLLAHIHAIETNSRTTVGDSDLVQRARRIMQDHLDDGIEVEAIASQVGVGYTHLLEIFRQYTGLTPYQYFLQLRMHRAKELLQNTRLSVKEVAARMNFENQYYFARLFRKKTGMSPSQWRAGSIISDTGGAAQQGAAVRR